MNINIIKAIMVLIEASILAIKFFTLEAAKGKSGNVHFDTNKKINNSKKTLRASLRWGTFNCRLFRTLPFFSFYLFIYIY